MAARLTCTHQSPLLKISSSVIHGSLNRKKQPIGIDGIKKAYRTGRGRVILRSRTSIEKIKGGKQQIVVTEIPYEVNKSLLVKKIDEIRLLKKVEGIAEVRDESDREGLRIVIELKRNAQAQGILNYLFKNTDLHSR